MKPSWTKIALLLAVSLLLWVAAACTQSKPAVPTATLAPLNSTPLLPAVNTPVTSGTPSGTEETTPTGPALATPESPSGVTPLPTPTSVLGPQSTPVIPPAITEPTVAAPPVTSGGACPNPYTVQRGDWIYSIARKCGVAPGALLAANPGINPNLVVAGMRLNIPGGGTSGGQPAPVPGSGKTYVVRQGDTLFSIATRYGTTVQVLMQMNGLSNPNFVYAGQVLNVP